MGTLLGVGSFQTALHCTRYQILTFSRSTSYLIISSIWFCCLLCDLDMACGHFDNDTIEVLKVKAYFCNADKSIFMWTGSNCPNCPNVSIYPESDSTCFNFHTLFFFLPPSQRIHVALIMTAEECHDTHTLLPSLFSLRIYASHCPQDTL